ncbi:MAG: hypothetical protein AAFV19_22795 [Pseudomonadota bacterium]
MSFRQNTGSEGAVDKCDRSEDGAEPVGHLTSLVTIEQRIVLCLRLWLDGPDYHQTTIGMLKMDYGTQSANKLMVAFEAFMSAVALSIERQVCRHAPACPCLGRDEAVLMTIVRHAALGDRFSATVHAARFVKEHRMPAVIEAAVMLGAEMAQINHTEVSPIERPKPTHLTRAVH